MRLPIVPVFTLRLLPFAMAAACLMGGASFARGEVNAQEQEIFNLLKNESGQRRPFVTLDPVLCQVARARAADMADRGYFDHTDPDGHGPNWWVEQAGYQLPATYDHSADGNNIESASAGRASAGDTWSDWLGSAPHKAHLLAQDSFYAAQTSIGVGYVRRSGSDYTHYWVILSAPPSGPQLAIKSPAGGSEVTDSSVTVSGTTGGNPAAASVQVRIENTLGSGAWTNATGSLSWSVNVSGLAPGANTLHARSLDATGAVLKEGSRNVRYVVLAPLLVQVSGEGSVTEGFAGTTMREIGESYKVTARPAAGWNFTGWSGSLNGTEASANFVMVQGLSLTANFIPNPFLSGAGRYTGIFVSGESRGLLRLNLASTGSFSGRARFGAVSVTLSGTFSGAGDAQVTATGSDGKTYSATLHYDAASAHVTGTLSTSGWSAALAADHLFAAGDGPSPYSGRYTVVIPSPSGAPSNLPQGDGVATLKVGSDGVVAGGGTLADGTSFVLKGTLTAGGEFPVYSSLYNRGGVVAGVLTFRSTTVSDVDGMLYWSRPARSGAPVFSGGFALSAGAIGSRYVPPAAGQPVVPVAPTSNNAELVLGDGGFGSPVNQATTLNADNSVVISAPELERISLRVSAPTGRFTGQFIHPATGAATKIRGVILQKQQAGFGFFASTSGGGYATFAPVGAAAVLSAP